MNATDKPLIIINESMQFSAGVNLNYVMEFVKKSDMKSVEKFIKYFQKTCKHLKYCENPVISAPSGLALGGGEEVLLQSNYVVSHTNIVMGLVETIVGLVPAGGAVKSFYGVGHKLMIQKMIQNLLHSKFLILSVMPKQLPHLKRQNLFYF